MSYAESLPAASSTERQDDSLSAILETPMTTPIPAEIVSKYLGQPPFLPLPGALNLRDACHGQECLRPGLLYRSGAPSYLPGPARTELARKYNVRLIIDTRTEREVGGPEANEVENKVWDAVGIKRVWIPGTGQASRIDLPSFVEGEGEKGWRASYAEVAERFPDAVKLLVTHLADKDAGAVLVNCTAGKDRTSVITAIALLLAGLPEEYIMHSHVLTRIGIEPHREVLTAKLLGWLSYAPAKKSDGEVCENVIKSVDDVPGLANFASVKPSGIKAFLDWLQETYGSVEKYLKKCGVDESTWELARANLKA